MWNKWLDRAFLVIATTVVAALAGFAPKSTLAQGGGFVVVANASVPTSSISKSDLSKLFTKKTRKWPGGTLAAPIDLAAGNPVRDAFTVKVHGKSTSAIGSYWQQQIFSGRDIPPPVRNSDDEVIEFVRANAGAVGYVAAGTQLGNGVKALTITD